MPGFEGAGSRKQRPRRNETGRRSQGPKVERGPMPCPWREPGNRTLRGAPATVRFHEGRGEVSTCGAQHRPHEPARSIGANDASSQESLSCRARRDERAFTANVGTTGPSARTGTTDAFSTGRKCSGAGRVRGAGHVQGAMPTAGETQASAVQTDPMVCRAMSCSAAMCSQNMYEPSRERA